MSRGNFDDDVVVVDVIVVFVVDVVEVVDVVAVSLSWLFLFLIYLERVLQTSFNLYRDKSMDIFVVVF